jgi:ribosomal protein S12 methylthiotransferase
MREAATTEAGAVPQFAIVTLGCAKNEVDSDRMRALLLAAGYRECDDVALADVVLINTCSFLVAATSESIEATLELAEARAAGTRTRPIVMCGCVPSRYGADLEGELPEVAAFVRHDEEDDIVAVVERVLGLDEADLAWEEDPIATAGMAEAFAMAEGGPNSVLLGDGRVLRTIMGPSSYVKISDGCDRFCSFCAIPYIRGRYFSRTSDEIVAEVAVLAEAGVREVILIGQDTGVWGCDLGEGENLARLLERVAEVMRPYHGWVRVLYLQPEGMTDELVATIRDTPEVLPYIDIPVQHCDEQVLAAMGRRGSRSELEELFARLRREIPGMVLRTTGMCGFPGESDEQFEELLDFVATQEFDYTSVFMYSPEDGTAAAEMDGQVDEDVKLERTQRLSDLAEALGFAATARHVGERVQVIIDGVEEGEDGPELIGHTWFQAPDSDGAVHIESGDVTVGDIVTCDLYDSVCYELYGRIVDDA